MARIRVEKKEEKEKSVWLPLCLKNKDHPIFISEPIRQDWIATYEYAVRDSNHYLAQEIKNKLSHSRDHVEGYRRLAKDKVKVLDTIGAYSKGNTDPRYLGMDVK
tara:strand:+ start:55 stop:369 length:315 start_codon:yes stop_codon:yes gene_type:complete